MTKAADLTFKTRSVALMEEIEIESYTGWERVYVCGAGGPIGGPYTTIRVRFDDGSERDILIDDVNWRRPPR